MEPLVSQPSLRDRTAPWVEGGLLALLVMVVVTLGGDAVRTSYHGFLHTGLGEAVLRDGLMPENPYHAGTPLHYYTLYPTLGVLLGQFGMGPLWGFAILNILAALLMGPALDALGKRFGLGFAARRCAFLAMVLGFNGLGYWWTVGEEAMPSGALPLLVLLDFTRPMEALQWDGRLQAFLPKFLNVSSYALALPFALFALADNLAQGRKQLLRCGALLGVTAAINPLVGGFVGLLVVAQKLPLLFQGLEGFKRLLPAAGVTVVLSLPFLLPLLGGAPDGEATLSGTFPFLGSGGWANLVGPLVLLWPLALLGLRHVPFDRLRPLGLAVGLAALFSFLSLPWGNEYKFPRLAGILLAIPAGLCLGAWWQRGFGKILVPLLALLCVPTTWVTVSAYAAWDIGDSRILDHVEDGRLALRAESAMVSWPPKLAAAEKELPADCVLVMHPAHPGARGSGMGAQGNQLLPVLEHALFVDSPQIHNATLPDLQERLDESLAFWEGRRWSAKPNEQTEPLDPMLAMQSMRSRIAPRPLAVVSLQMHEPSVTRLKALKATLVAEENGVALWLLPGLPEADDN
ncbi:MAG: hypothetical protein ACYTEP_10970 [Planctomycetota bacterium]